jgi:hypothetical protein
MRQKKRTLILGVYAAVVLLMVLTLAALLMTGETVELSFAEERKWTARPIVHEDLSAGFIGRIFGKAWEDLPFEIDAEEEEDVKECVRLAQRGQSSTNGVKIFSLDETREKLEAVLARRPDFFYAEYLLGKWHEMNGDRQKAEELIEAAYRHAPVTIAQPYRFEDGRPLAGVAIQQFALECNRVKNGSLNPNLQLEYYDLVTDKEGCIYLPAYDTVFRTNNMASPRGYDVDYPRLGWFATTSRIGVLPPAIVSPKEM